MGFFGGGDWGISRTWISGLEPEIERLAGDGHPFGPDELSCHDRGDDFSFIRLNVLDFLRASSND